MFYKASTVRDAVNDKSTLKDETTPLDL